VAVTHPYAAPRAGRWFPLRPTDTPVRRFAVLAPVGLALVVGLGAWLFADAGILAILAGAACFVISGVFAADKLGRHHPHALLGFANAVTLLRLALVSALVIPLVGGTPAPVAIIVIATLSLSLDGVDGWLARRQGLSSPFGAGFDVEVDSIFALVLALLAFVVGGVGWWVILLGLPRYLFGLAQLTLPWLTATLPPRYSAKVICVIQLILLIVVQSPWVPEPLATILIVVVLGALAWSFGRDIVALWRLRS
jgi:phosphatidylglycerophosphate synthase